MNIILLCGNQPNQIALANKIAERFNLSAIVVEKHSTKSKKVSFTKLINAFLNRTIFQMLHHGWFGMMDFYNKKYAEFPDVEKLVVENINADETVEFIKKIEPDILMVSGTGMIKKKILELNIPKGIINLHTGLSPYIKGGPNCTNWCISENKFHLIGNTVMWIDAGIDSGDILATALTPISGDENFLELHIKVMEHAHELYLSALQKINVDENNSPRIKQSSISAGVTYYNRMWNYKAKKNLLKNFKQMKMYFSSGRYKNEAKEVITVSL